MKNALIVIQSLVIIGLLIFIARDRYNLFVTEKELSDYSIDELRSMIDGKSKVNEMTPEEWTISNHIALKTGEELGIDMPDTLSYNTALIMQAMADEQEKRENDLLCSKQTVVEQFHQMMEFNMPHHKYKKNSIKVQQMGKCKYHIALTVSESQYIKSFYIYEIFLRDDGQQYSMRAIKNDMLY